MINIDDLNNMQKDAVKYNDGPLLILAGAGSGKTRVLTYKIAYLLEQKIVKPWEILAITFTNKAAKEMKERAVNLIGDEAEMVWLGTFHSVCVRILKREIENLGYSREFNIFDELDKDKVIKEVLKKLNISDKEYPVSLIKYEISRAKDQMIDYSKYKEQVIGDFRREKIAEVYEMYQKTLKQNDALDFDDILMLTVKLFLDFPDRLSYYQSKFKYILVDEYQDTNKVQFLLINLLSKSHGHICVVGDESQSIYGFRGADISNILNFEKAYPKAKIIKLEENYRSTQNILNAANEVIKNNKSKIDKKLWTSNSEGEKIEYKTLDNEYEEVEYIVENIDKMCREYNMSYKDFAVLFRTNAQARVLEDVFMRTSTPYRLIGGLKFYSRKEIKDLTSYLKLIQNRNDNIALKRIINEPKRGIGDTTVDKLDSLANANNMSIFDYIQSDDNLKGLRGAANIIAFRELINDLIAKKDMINVSELMEEVLEKSGYENMLNQADIKEAEMRFDNLKEFIGVAKEFEMENAENSLADFLESIALVSDVDNLDENDEAVTLMTMHSAKGLEFEVVFLVGMEEGLFPSQRSIDEDEECEEERRLCYVAITRAKKMLYITNVKRRTLYGSTNYSIPSRFIDEIPEELLSDLSKDNISLRKRKSNTFIDQEYSDVQNTSSKLSSYFTNFSTSNTSANHKTKKASFGVNVESFLNNLNNTAKTSVKNVDNSSKYYVGMCVKHKKFGVGTIDKIEPEGDDLKLDIMFDKFGFKRLMAKYTPLEILE